MSRSWLRGAAVIARGEWVHYDREHGGAGRSGWLVILAVVLGVGAYGIGREVATGGVTPFGVLGIVSFATILWAGWRGSRLTKNVFDELNPDLLLVTVPARVPALGLVAFVAARSAVVLSVPTIAVAVGAAVGLRAPGLALTTVVAAGALLGVATGIGVTARLAMLFVTSRLSRGRTYRDLLVLFGWLPIVVGWFVLIDTVERVSLSWLAAAPTRGIADLALVGAAGRTGAAPESAIATLAILVIGAALSVGTTTYLARRLWEGEPAGRAPKVGSHALLEPGWVERLTGDRIPQPIRTVARKRWLVERRTARGLLYAGLSVGFAGIVFPVGIIGLRIPVFVLIVHCLGLAVGLAFGTDPIGIEYRGLSMLLTSVDGRSFVGGLLLAALAPALVVVPAVVVPLGAVSTATAVETASLVVFGVAISACTASLSLASGLGVDRSAIVPHPGYFTDAPWYTEIGWGQFRRIGSMLLVVTAAALPAFVGLHPVVYEYLGGVGIPIVLTRSLAALLGSLVAVVVTRTAFGIAATRFEGYSFG